MKTQTEKAADFARLHERGCFVIPNPWDRGTARLLAGLGFRALTTTSAGYARSLGVSDYQAGRNHVLEHVRDLAAATDLPLAADLENGFGHAPEVCADTIARLQAYQEAGADVLYAPGISTAEEIGEICRSVDRPVNVLGGIGKKPLSVCELAELGVRRVSLGSWLHSAAMTAFVNAAQDESFGYVAELIGGRQMDQWMKEGAG